MPAGTSGCTHWFGVWEEIVYTGNVVALCADCMDTVYTLCAYLGTLTKQETLQKKTTTFVQRQGDVATQV